ncbi:syntenin-1 [Nephila pilipes]|uniref:Syntenin-1 n=1 Tax=Nephila pilipes TaxID=299642 RepID=A0A8X6TJN7_NEPPI|nr:syntenin-1 [Nephila pilipes]
MPQVSTAPNDDSKTADRLLLRTLGNNTVMIAFVFDSDKQIKMSLYPSLEDMKVDQMARAQIAHANQAAYPPAYPSSGHSSSHSASAPPYPTTATSKPVSADQLASLYPVLDEYMGLQLPQHMQQYQSTAVVPASQNTVAVPSVKPTTMVAPISGNSVGLARAQVTHGLREIILCKDGNGRVGLRVQAVNKGVFVILVQKNTPAALAGLRFGDQILMINDVAVAGFSMDDVHKMIKKANPNRITMVVRDRPFERTITVHKDSAGTVGFGFKNGKIINIVKDTSAARNGVLIDHNLLEVNGQNVVGLKDKEISAIIREATSPVTVTIMPTFVYDHMLKNTASSFIKKTMDHSIPDL